MLVITLRTIFCLPVCYTKTKINMHRIVTMPFALYGCEIRSLTMGKEHWPRGFQNRVLMKTFGPQREQMTQ